jgi:hypothetical protein
MFFTLILLLLVECLSVPVFSFGLSPQNKQAYNVFAVPDAEVKDYQPVFQKGLSYSSWSPDAFDTAESDESLSLLTETNTEWVAICFAWAQSNITSSDIKPDPNRTATVESVRRAITTAHRLGLKVMLKPMVDTLQVEETQGYSTVWRGKILPSQEWFESYQSFINYFAEFAEQNGVEMFCVGCEFAATTSEKAQWESVIQGVRERYSGPITYAADWTNYKSIEWWDSVNYVGIDAYFLLTLFDNDPTLEDLKNAWNNHANEIEEWVSTVNKPVIFTEIGYRSGDGTAMAPSNYWSDMTVDLQEQSDCYEAAFQTLWNRDWFYGFYWWTWIHDPTKGGLTDSGHTPQNKPAQELLTEWYSKDRQYAVVDETVTSNTKTRVSQTEKVAFHVSWQNNAADSVGCRVYINGTEHITNSTGWISFSATYETVGKRTWIVTDLQHEDANGYTINAENPAIIWDKTDFQVEVDVGSFGSTKVVTTITNAYDGSPVADASVQVNGELSQETEPGVYETQVESWSPYQQLTVTADTLGEGKENWTTSTFHLSNTILYVVIALGLTATVVVLFKFRRGNGAQSVK